MIPTPFRGSRCATGLGDYRPRRSTHERYPIESLPLLDEPSFTDGFAWRGDIGHVLKEQAATIVTEEIENLPGFDSAPDYEIVWCAPTVEIFAYRFWTENMLWFALHDSGSIEDLGEARHAYLGHHQAIGHERQ